MIKDGIINVNKPQDWTSHDAVKVLRKITGQKRIGHTGTLDPMATGVLPICFGKAARVMEYLDLDYKEYICSLKLGLRTDTLDIWGETIEESLYDNVDENMIAEAVESFRGEIEQIPPKYSAIKVDGRKLYDYARAGEDVEIKARRVYIREIELLETDLEQGKVSFRTVCSKGTYIRSICRDIGEKLGCGAAMSSLKRTASGMFKIEDAIDLEKLRALPSEEIEKLLKNADYPLIHFGKGTVDMHGGKWFINGGWLEPRRVKIIKKPLEGENLEGIEIKDVYKRTYNIYEGRGEEEIFLGTAYYDEEKKMYIPDKIFLR